MTSAHRADAEYYYSLSGKRIVRFWRLKSLLNPSLRAAYLFRVAAASTGLKYLVVRSLLICLHSCDVASGAKFSGPIYLPHPLGIVVGAGVRVGARVWLFQNVTLGRDGAGGYPMLGDDSRLFAGCVVVGGVQIPAHSRVAALQFVSASTPLAKSN